ncbi:MAG TPA: magnesium and cobalt transport protein CorA [Miltoncostaeaceae bacterium]|nr:magnesium and cobalt transport protein CorA [Miltoncostaeaceae bacterium]
MHDGPSGVVPVASGAVVIVGKAVYRGGHRVDAGDDLGAIAQECRAGAGVAWIGLSHPSAQEFRAIAEQFRLHELAVEDAVTAHQRPKLERYGDTLFVVLRTTRYIDETETVDFGELHVFAGPGFVVTVRHGEGPDLAEVRRSLEGRPGELARGTSAILHAIADRVVDDYAPVAAGIENDIDEIEDEVFGAAGNPSRRIYALMREVIGFGRAVTPLPEMLGQLMEGRGPDDEELRKLRDVQDHALRVQEQVGSFRELLQNILSVNLTLETRALSEASNRQNEEVKRISAWAAILFAPTLVGTVYGMNFEHMPELHWAAGYPMALGLMLLSSVVLYLVFKGRRWI